MSMTRAFKYEDAIAVGSAVVAGVADGAVALPGADGAGVFAGVYSAYGNTDKTLPDTNDSIGITVHGECKVRVSGAVTAFAFGKVADDTGAMEALGAAPATPVTVTGFFLESGSDGDLVDFFVQPYYLPASA